MSSATITPSESQPATRGSWRVEGAVLAHLLDHHPRRLTLWELADEVGSPTARLDLARAVRNLVAARFLSFERGALAPTTAVLDFDRSDLPTDF